MIVDSWRLFIPETSTTNKWICPAKSWATLFQASNKAAEAKLLERKQSKLIRSSVVFVLFQTNKANICIYICIIYIYTYVYRSNLKNNIPLRSISQMFFNLGRASSRFRVSREGGHCTWRRSWLKRPPKSKVCKEDGRDLSILKGICKDCKSIQHKY